MQTDEATAHLATLQPLVGLAVQHRLWGAGRIVAVRGTGAAQFPAGLAIVVEFARGSGDEKPFTVADLWGGGRFVRPALPTALRRVGVLLDALLAAVEPAPALPPRGAGGSATQRASASPTTAIRPASWARDFMRRDDWVLLDTETTGLDSNAEIIDLAVLDRHGTVLLDNIHQVLETRNL